ncbi:MAG TPA: hypothetical protein VMT22_01965, partial [Terriglobales bacterium]|nr:hypothetical protein [Terriglobales bacterium]
AAQAVCSAVGAMVSVNDFAARPARALADGEVLAIGRHRRSSYEGDGAAVIRGHADIVGEYLEERE